MPASAKLILVRHGESVVGQAKRYAGHRDTPLSPRGRAQVSRLRARFRRLEPEVVVSSDLRRCLQTARLLAPQADIVTSSRLRELDFGDWDGRTAEAARRQNPPRFDRWMRDPWTNRTPGGESLRQLRSRVRRAVVDLVRKYPDRRVAIITHAGPIRTLLNPDPARFWDVAVPPASLFELDWR
jgi:broad specificity phosphatase PhoE